MAELVRPVGLRGELRALVLDDFIEGVLSTPFARRQRRGGSVEDAALEGFRWQGQALVVKLRGVDDRTAAQGAVSDRLGFLAQEYHREGFPRPAHPLPFEFAGLRVETVAGEVVGTVEDVLVLPASLVLRVARPNGPDALVPVVPALVPSVDRGRGVVVVRAIPGLLDGEAWIDEES